MSIMVDHQHHLAIKYEFYENLQNAVDDIDNSRGMIMMGDLTATVGSKGDNEVIGRFNEEHFNVNANRQIDFCS